MHGFCTVGFGLFRRQYRLGCRQHFLRRCRFICREKLLPYFFEPWGNGALFFRLHHLHGGRSDRCFIGSRYFRRCGDDFCRFFRCCLLRGGFLCRGNRRLCQCQLDRVQDAGGGVSRAPNRSKRKRQKLKRPKHRILKIFRKKSRNLSRRPSARKNNASSRL